MESVFLPNESVDWGLMVVLYTFFSALSQGGITIALFSFVFGKKELEPLARFSLLTTFGLLVVSPLPLLLHLGKPLRSYLIFIVPNFSSPLALFSLSFLLHVLLLGAILWLLARRDAERLVPSRGLRAFLWRPFRALLPLKVSPEAVRFGERSLRVLLVADFCIALVFHGYVGYLFGSFSWHPWWSSSLMPLLFVVSSETGGLALVALAAVLAFRFRQPSQTDLMITTLGRSIAFALLVETGLEAARLLILVAGSGATWQAVSGLLTGPLFATYIVVQVLLGLLALAALIPVSLGKLPGRLKPRTLLILGSLLVVVHVFAMRWNVVIGGQLVPRSLEGLRSFVPSWTGQEGLLLSVAMLFLPVVAVCILMKVFVPWAPGNAQKEMTLVGNSNPIPGRGVQNPEGGDR
ncbi:MAG: NrfD/PsrC family molybdoenzyme membrane anchor subunit [Planctomycetota bacterium]|jgi:Ni/Fe-hydrogenase subunit HybB-like protein